MPVALATFALAAIVVTWLLATAHVTSRRRLHPLFALGVVVADVSGGVVRSTMRLAGDSLATMARWMLPHR